MSTAKIGSSCATPRIFSKMKMRFCAYFKADHHKLEQSAAGTFLVLQLFLFLSFFVVALCVYSDSF